MLHDLKKYSNTPYYSYFSYKILIYDYYYYTTDTCGFLSVQIHKIRIFFFLQIIIDIFTQKSRRQLCNLIYSILYSFCYLLHDMLSNE